MKDWNYYRNPVGVRYMSGEELNQYRTQLLEEINNKPMTAAEREEALKQLPARVLEYQREQNAPYIEAAAELEREFWRDVREELGYDQFLTEAGVSVLEAEAYERGHSAGFSEIYNCMRGLVEFCRKIVQHAKRPEA